MFLQKKTIIGVVLEPQYGAWVCRENSQLFQAFHAKVNLAI